MSSRPTGRQMLVAVLLGVLVGGGLMAVTPAGAEVSNAVATKWKKIWKQELQPQADKRYYTKKKSDKRYYTKSKSNERYYTKWDSDAKYALKGSSYTKAESDGRYLPKQALIRGQYAAFGTVAAGQRVGDNITFGVSLSAAPTVNYLNAGAAPTAACPGTAAAPNAAPGNLCVYEGSATNAATPRTIWNAGANAAGASVYGAIVYANATAAGETAVYGSWALRPAAIVSAP